MNLPLKFVKVPLVYVRFSVLEKDRMKYSLQTKEELQYNYSLGLFQEFVGMLYNDSVVLYLDLLSLYCIKLEWPLTH